MAEEPGGWELRRALEQQRTDMREGFAQINARLDRLVSQDAFTAEQRRVDDRLKDLADDIAAEKVARQQAILDERRTRDDGDQRQQDQLDKLTTNLRWVAVSVILPIALFLANLLVSHGGR